MASRRQNYVNSDDDVQILICFKLGNDYFEMEKTRYLLIGIKIIILRYQ